MPSKENETSQMQSSNTSEKNEDERVIDAGKEIHIPSMVSIFGTGDERIDKHFGKFTWGSCQYESAAAFFAALEETKQKLGTRDAALAEFGITFKYTCINTIETIWPEFKEEMEEHYTGSWREEDYVVELFADLETMIPSYDNLFIHLANCSWDLWSAAPFIASFVFAEHEIDGVKTAPGAGPTFNIMSQGENFNVGVWCWLMWEAGLIKDQSVFRGFDT